jgi:hypothetical protein
MTVPNNTYGDIDYNDPSTFTVKHLPSPDAWPGNGPAWLFWDDTREVRRRGFQGKPSIRV